MNTLEAIDAISLPPEYNPYAVLIAQQQKTIETKYIRAFPRREARHDAIVFGIANVAYFLYERNFYTEGVELSRYPEEDPIKKLEGWKEALDEATNGNWTHMRDELERIAFTARIGARDKREVLGDSANDAIAENEKTTTAFLFLAKSIGY